MMRAGTDFTYNGTRYAAGDPFRLELVPAHQRGSFRRLYGLTEQKRIRRTTFTEEQTS